LAVKTREKQRKCEKKGEKMRKPRGFWGLLGSFEEVRSVLID